MAITGLERRSAVTNGIVDASWLCVVHGRGPRRGFDAFVRAAGSQVEWISSFWSLHNESELMAPKKGPPPDAKPKAKVAKANTVKSAPARTPKTRPLHTSDAAHQPTT